MWYYGKIPTFHNAFTKLPIFIRELHKYQLFEVIDYYTFQCGQKT